MQIFGADPKAKAAAKATDKENAMPGYVFDVRCTESWSDRNSESAQEAEKTEEEIQKEIQSIFRQITASVTFLPMLDGNCTFNVLVYADADSDVPLEWGDSDAKEIRNGEKVQLRSFSTNSHRVDTLVSYRFVLAINSVLHTCSQFADWQTESRASQHPRTLLGALRPSSTGRQHDNYKLAYGRLRIIFRCMCALADANDPFATVWSRGTKHLLDA